MSEPGVNEYVWVGGGTAIGAMAHFGRMIAAEGWPSVRHVFGFLLQTGLVAVVSASISQRLGLHQLDESLIAAILAVSANETFNFVRAKAAWMLASDHSPHTYPEDPKPGDKTEPPAQP